jgi:hypothetical protein
MSYWLGIEYIGTVMLLQGVSQVKDTTWSASLAEYIRHHDTQLLEQATRLVQRFESELLVCESFAELIDTLGELRTEL